MVFGEDNLTLVIQSVLQCLGSLVWPFSVLIVILYFRREVAELISRVIKVKIPGGGEIVVQPEDPEATSPGGKAEEQIRLFDPSGFYTPDGLKSLIDDSGLVEPDEHQVDRLLLFQTKNQHTWLLTTSRQIFCVLDDERTRSSGRLIQWRMSIEKAKPIRAYVSGMGNPVVGIGEKRSWLYSRRLHPSPTDLETDIENMLEPSTPQ